MKPFAAFALSATVFCIVTGSVSPLQYIYAMFTFVPLAGYVLIYRVMALRDRRTMRCQYWSPATDTEQMAATAPGATDLSWPHALLLLTADIAVMVGLCMMPSQKAWAFSVAVGMVMYMGVMATTNR
jgi:hypothetical protein